jgi:hypothetical protein
MSPNQMINLYFLYPLFVLKTPIMFEILVEFLVISKRGFAME